MRRLGGQTPTFEAVGEWATTRGPEAVELFEAYGRNYYGSQRHEMDVFFARDEDGLFAAKSIGITKPRQNGKSFAVRDYAVWMAVVEGKSVLYTAHLGRTVRKMFKEICDFLGSNEDFKEETSSIYKAGGYEGIYLRNGACIEFQTRTNSGGRGGTYQVVVFDEAQELTNAQQDAILPTVSAAGEIDAGESDPQKIYIGTVPGPECQGTVFREMHDRVHGGGSSVWWLEWGVSGKALDEVPIDDVDLWYACNPAMGRRMSEATVRDEHDSMSRDGFARERLGWWTPAQSFEGAIEAADWDACKEADPSNEGTVSYAVRFSSDGSTGCIAACHRNEVPFVYVVDCVSTANGIQWFAEELAKRHGKAAQIVIDGQSNAQDLNDRLLAAGVPKRVIARPTAGDVIAACSSFANAVKERRVAHWGQPVLDASAVGSAKRKIGTSGGWGFRSTDQADATPVEACALAYWAAMTTKRKPGRKAVLL